MAAVAVAGCGGADDSIPTACLEGQSLYLGRDRGGVLISECLTPNQGGGELATVGAAMLAAATKLNAEAREDPGGAANLQLGFLLGAAQRGAEGTEGIHDELVRRLAAAARYSPDNRPLPAVFLATYRRGFDAGIAQG
ncbi:MAG TPA: hypothetical protein VH703_04865 [Solirubrobacterales bacterium]